MRSNIYGLLWISIGFFAGAFLALATPAHADYSIITSSDTSGGGQFGSTAVPYFAQSFLTGGVATVSTLSVRLGSNSGTPSNLYFTIEADSGGFPSGTPIGTSDQIAYTSVHQSCVDPDTVTFSTPVSLDAATTYWIVGQSVSPTSDYYTQCGSTDDYPYGTRARKDPSWETLGGDWSMTIFFVEGGGGGGGGGTATTSTSTSSSLPFNKQETLFMFGIFLFIASVPFWERILHIRNRYV